MPKIPQPTPLARSIKKTQAKKSQQIEPQMTVRDFADQLEQVRSQLSLARGIIDTLTACLYSFGLADCGPINDADEIPF